MPSTATIDIALRIRFHIDIGELWCGKRKFFPTPPRTERLSLFYQNLYQGLTALPNRS